MQVLWQGVRISRGTRQPRATDALEGPAKHLQHLRKDLQRGTGPQVPPALPRWLVLDGSARSNSASL